MGQGEHDRMSSTAVLKIKIVEIVSTHISGEVDHGRPNAYFIQDKYYASVSL